MMKTNFPGSLLDIEYYLPEKVVTNEEFDKQFPEWNVEKALNTVGVKSRHYAEENETALDLAKEAIKKLFKKYPELTTKIDGLIFCTQSPDYVMPSNSFLIQRDFNLNQNMVCYDINLACSGYIYGLMQASALLSTGLCHNILIVTGDTYSKYLKPDDRSTRLLFGDGASVSWVGSPNPLCPKPMLESFVDFSLASDGAGWDKFIIEAGGCRNPLTKANEEGSKIYMNGLQVLNFVNSKVTVQLKTFMEKHALNTENVEQFVFHQASRLALETLKTRFKIPQEKVTDNLIHVGNTVSSSIPIALKDYMTKNTPKDGSNVVLCGFGVGFSWGTMLAKR